MTSGEWIVHWYRVGFVDANGGENCRSGKVERDCRARKVVVCRRLKPERCERGVFGPSKVGLPQGTANV
jgi:hypothetical protein